MSADCYICGADLCFTKTGEFYCPECERDRIIEKLLNFILDIRNIVVVWSEDEAGKTRILVAVNKIADEALKYAQNSKIK